jgi:hypothetical protein
MDRGIEARPRTFYPDYVNAGPRAMQTPSWDLATERQITDGRTLGKGLGWFSIGLGLLEVFAPTKVTSFLGIDEDHAHLVQLYGLRELTSGVAILAERTPKFGVWSRVPGDALDLATLGAFARESSKPGNVMMAMGMVAGISALDTKCAMDLVAAPDGDDGADARRRAA